ncbi:MAG: acetyltransferase [Planctomycetota bacterium]
MSERRPARASGPLVIIAGGRHALIVAEAAQLANIELSGYLDDDSSAGIRVVGSPVNWLGPLREFDSIGESAYIIALGKIHIRREVIDLIDGANHEGSSHAALTIVHPTAFVSPSAELGTGVYVGPQAVVNSRAKIGDHAIINTGAIVEHDCVVGENSHIAPGAVMGGDVTIGRDTLIGVGARMIPHVSVGHESIVGAGAVVVRDVPDEAVVMGVPAR